MSEGSDPTRWGRVDADGTVYVRTPDGERVVGSWLAGPPEEGLAYYARRYADLLTEVDLLERRAASGDPAAARSGATTLRAALVDARAVGDLAALEERLAAVEQLAQDRLDARRAERAAAAAAVAARQEELAVEAEALAERSDWKAAGDRLRALVEEWKDTQRAPGRDRRAETARWRRIAAAREEFTRRRGAHFAARAEGQHASRDAKERIVAEAERLAGSDQWAPTAARFRSLMTEWKAAGRSGKAADDELWQRFRTAQETFFARRNAAFAERDEQERRRQQRVRQSELANAAATGPARDPTGGRPQRPDPAGSPLVTRLRESVGKLEARARRAREEGRDADAAAVEEALATQRQWLRRAESVR